MRPATCALYLTNNKQQQLAAKWYDVDISPLLADVHTQIRTCTYTRKSYTRPHVHYKNIHAQIVNISQDAPKTKTTANYSCEKAIIHTITAVRKPNASKFVAGSPYAISSTHAFPSQTKNPTFFHVPVGSADAFFDQLFERGKQLQEEMDNATLAEVFVPIRPETHSTSHDDSKSTPNSTPSTNAADPAFNMDVQPLMEADIVEMLVPTLLETEKERRKEEQLMQRVLPSVLPSSFGGPGLTEELTRVYAVNVLIHSVWLSERLRIKTVCAC